MRRSTIDNSYALSIGHATNRGVVREVNEDSYLVLTVPAVAPGLDALLAVADGMGGHRAGDVASGEVIRALDELFTSSRYQEQIGYSPQRDDYYIVVVKEVLEQIHERLNSLSNARPELRDMGTTGSIGLLAGGRLYLGHVGDSRVYRLRGVALQQLTLDHRWVTEQVQAGLLTPEQAARSEERNKLTRCLGKNLVLRVDRAAYDVQVGDRYLLCTDGLTEVIGDRELAELLVPDSPLQQVCDQLVDLANRRGGPDNITVVLAQIGKGEGSDVPGGRAFGPHRLSAQSQQADTVKMPRRRRRARPAGRRSRSASTGTQRKLLLIALVAILVSLAFTFVGAYVLGLLGPEVHPVEVLGLETKEAPGLYVMVLVFLAVLSGIGLGLLLSRWLPEVSNSTATANHQRAPDQNTPPA